MAVLNLNSIPKPYPEQRKRWHQKTTTGCITCRKRRVKCDEQKPRCKNCVRNKIVCHGEDYEAASVDGSKGIVVHSANGYGAAHIGSTTSSDKRNAGRAFEPDGLLTALAGSKSDPFNIFCVDSSPRQHQQIFDHAINSQWSVFAASQGDLAVVKTDVMSHVIHSPVSYHTFLYAGACHRLFWKDGFERSPERTAELLTLKNKAIRAMMAAIEPGFDNVSDEVLIAMLLLAAHGSAEHAQRRRFSKLQIRKAQGRPYDNEYWCALDTERPHMDILAEMVRKRGLKNIRPGPLLNALCLFDVLDSYCHARRPRIDSLAPFSFVLTMRTWPSDAVAQQRLEKTTNGFSEVFSCMGTSNPSMDLQQVVHGLTYIELDLDQLNRNADDPEKVSPHYASVLWIRSMCVRELLLLPDTLTANEDTAQQSPLVPLVYEMCRVSCLLACQVWLHPDYSCTRNLARSMVDKLHPLLVRATKGTGSDRLCEELPNFFLWSLILGIVLAYEDFDKTGSLKGMYKLAPFVNSAIVKARPSAWPVISRSMENFLWPANQQEETGREAWELVCQIIGDA